MEKSFLKLFFTAILGGIIGAWFLFTINSVIFGANISGTIDPKTEVLVNTSTLVPDPELWEKIVTKTSPSLVGIQTISNDRVIRQGGGIIISSDGLIVTTTDLWGPKESVYQIFYDDKIVKGELVDLDPKIRLLLLKTAVLNYSIAELNSANYKSGQEILVIGKTLNLSKPITVSQKGIISQATDTSVLVDTIPNQYLFGFGASDKDGRLRGMVYLKNGAVNLIKTEIIENFFKTYLEKIYK